mgnify:CR=1 FL=1
MVTEYSRKALSGRLVWLMYIATGLLFLAAMYGFWNLWAGYNGFFTPYLIAQNNLPAWTATMLPASYFLIGMISILTIFMTLSDKVNQRLLFGISAALHVLGMALLAIFGVLLVVMMIFRPGGVIGFNFGMGLGLNEKSSFSIGYDHSSVGRLRLNGAATPDSVRVQLGTLVLGYSYRLHNRPPF